MTYVTGMVGTHDLLKRIFSKEEYITSYIEQNHTTCPNPEYIKFSHIADRSTVFNRFIGRVLFQRLGDIITLRRQGRTRHVTFYPMSAEDYIVMVHVLVNSGVSLDIVDYIAHNNYKIMSLEERLEVVRQKRTLDASTQIMFFI